MSPLVSICIPTYKQTSLLRENLDSICKQTYKNVEIILSDDTPGDEVKELIREYEAKLPLKYFHHHPSLGSPANWNFVLEKAVGELVLLLHHDDQFANEQALQKMLAPFTDPTIDFVFGRNETTDAQPRATQFDAAYWASFYKDPSLLTATNLLGAPSNVLLKKSAVTHYDTQLKWIVDIELYTRLFKAGKKLVFVNEHLITTGRHEGQITNICLEDKTIQVYEYVYYAHKHMDKIRHTKVYDFYWRLFRNSKIRSINDLENAGLRRNQIPGFVKRMVAFQSKIPVSYLQIGPVSKALMLVSFLTAR